MVLIALLGICPNSLAYSIVTGSNVEKLSNEYHLKSHQERIEKLNSQIDFLNKENFTLEDDLKKAKRDLSRTDHVRDENTSLSSKIRNLQTQNEQLQEVAEQTEKALDRLRGKRIQEDNDLIAQKNDDIEKLRQKVKELTDVLDTVESENIHLKGNSNQASTSPPPSSFLTLTL